MPIYFAVFMRLFFILFNFIYGALLVYILGKHFSSIITGVAIVTSLIFSVAALSILWNEYKKHILES